MTEELKKMGEKWNPDPKNGENGEDDDFLSQEVASLEEVFKVLVKAIKNLKIYLSNNPVHQRFIKEFYSKLSVHIENYGEAVITVGQYTLTCHSQIIYENINRLDSLAFKLFVDGVRQVTLSKGISEEESGNFLDVLGKSFDSERPDDDLVTLLWQKNFHHIKFQIIEDFFSDDEGEVLASQLEVKNGLTNMFQAELKNRENLQKDKETNKENAWVNEQASRFQFHQIFRLTEDEILNIKKEMKLESEKDLISELTGIIYAVLQVEKDELFFKEVIDLLIKNSVHLVEEGDLEQVEKIGRLFVSLKEQIPPLSNQMMEILNHAIDFLGKPEYLSKIEAHLNTLDEKKLFSLSSFLKMLNPSCVNSVIDILSKAKVRKTRKELSDILVDFGKKDITPILARLQGSQWYVIRNLVQVIGQIGNQQAVDSLKKIAQYPDERVRKEIVYALMLIGKENEKARDLILTFLNDLDSGIRKQAIQIIQTNKYDKAFPILWKIISSDEFYSRDTEERYLIFGALGKLGDHDLLPLLKDYLKPTFLSFVKRNRKEEMAICALYALRHMDIPESIHLLTEAKKHPYKLVSDFASKALYEIQKTKNKRELNIKNET